ncbi:MAG: EAL domain-containing protein [Caulobacter sp.]|nr:EAL domain-containing protein [Caulobacter sp.]
MGNKNFGIGVVATAAAAGVVTLAAVVGILFSIARHADLDAEAHERTQVLHGLAGVMREKEAWIARQADWDDALLNLGIAFNPDWARANVGQYFSNLGHFERAYVLDADNRPVYAMNGGKDVALAQFEQARAATEPLVRQIREAEARRSPIAGSAPYRTVLSKPIQASTFGSIDGVPYIITASLVQNDFGRVRARGRAPVLIAGEALNRDFARLMADRFLLKDLHVHAVDNMPDDKGQTSFMLTNGGAPIGRVDWTGHRPGLSLLSRVLPPVISGLILLLALTVSLLLRGRRATRALVASEARARHMAFHDLLTGLPNRAMFNERVAEALDQARRQGARVGVMAIDLDRFKLVNDTYGHGAGDQLILAVAARLNSLCPAGDSVVRVGGDEFVILSRDASAGRLAHLARRIVDRMAEPVDLPFGRVFVGASIGISLVEDPGIDGAEALRQADLAMYRAKEGGRGRFCFFEPDMDTAMKARRQLEADLREALNSDGLTMVYQPQMNGHGRMTGVEALVRWNHPESGPIAPSYFVPIAEEGGLISQLGVYTFRKAFLDSRRWPQLRVAVNVSAVQIRAVDFPDLLADLLKETGADPHQIELEITEGILLADDEQTQETFRRLRAMGFSLALDDFGTGYSSLSYLRRYPVDKIKIDRSFVNNLGVEKEAEAVVGAIVRLAQALNLRVIAEGVETESQLEGLKRAGCTDIQGYLYSKPVDPADISRMLVTVQARPLDAAVSGTALVK